MGVELIVVREQPHTLQTLSAVLCASDNFDGLDDTRYAGVPVSNEEDTNAGGGKRCPLVEMRRVEARDSPPSWRRGSGRLLDKHDI